MNIIDDDPPELEYDRISVKDIIGDKIENFKGIR